MTLPTLGVLGNLGGLAEKGGTQMGVDLKVILAVGAALVVLSALWYWSKRSLHEGVRGEGAEYEGDGDEVEVG